MLQSLLEDRFKLKVHRESRELSKYVLTVNKKAKLTPAQDGEMIVKIEQKSFPVRAGGCGTTLWLEGARVICHAVGMEKIVAEFSNLLQAPISDQTELSGTYDLNLLYLPDSRRLDPNAPPVPTLQEAVQQELGLKLEKVKGPVDVLVIDHMEKPSEN
jgi:uncharacterized protein (TIGR03435 family)